MKPFLTILVLLICCDNSKAQETDSKWFLGIRSGTYIEMADAGYYGSTNSLSTISWSKQVFFQKRIKDHFLLEMTIMHFSIVRDLTGQKKNTLDQHYLSYKFNHQKLAHTLSIYYNLFNRNRLGIYAGIGAGVLSCWERYRYTYIDQSGHNQKEKNSIMSIEAINFSASLVANYDISDRWMITGNTGLSILSSGKSLAGYALNIGVGYKP